MASGGRHGFAQSLFQVGGSTGSAIGPLLAAFIVVPRGQSSIAWFSAAALLAILLAGSLTNPLAPKPPFPQPGWQRADSLAHAHKAGCRLAADCTQP
jgi:MFS transporter, FSR family, fosmidomycin resistance protein